MTSAAAVGPVFQGRGTGTPVCGLFELGAELFAQGQYEEAILALRRRLLLAPNDVNARRMLALSLLRCGEVRRAADTLAPVRTSPAVGPEVCRQIGEALLPDDAKAARPWLAAVLTARPGDELARRRLAEVDASLQGESRRAGRHRLDGRSWWKPASAR